MQCVSVFCTTNNEQPLPLFGTKRSVKEEVNKVNIPLLMVHGDVDSRVLYYHFEDYKKAFEAAGKQGEFVTLEKADHFYRTLMYTHQQQFYTKMLDYLANDCGPGGL